MSKNFRTFFHTISNLEHHYSLMLNFFRFDTPNVGRFFVFGALRVCLWSACFAETENFLLKGLEIEIKVSWNSIAAPWIIPKSAMGPMNSCKNKLNSKISWLFNLEPNKH